MRRLLCAHAALRTTAVRAGRQMTSEGGDLPPEWDGLFFPDAPLTAPPNSAGAVAVDSALQRPMMPSSRVREAALRSGITRGADVDDADSDFVVLSPGRAAGHCDDASPAGEFAVGEGAHANELSLLGSSEGAAHRFEAAELASLGDEVAVAQRVCDALDDASAASTAKQQLRGCLRALLRHSRRHDVGEGAAQAIAGVALGAAAFVGRHAAKGLAGMPHEAPLDPCDAVEMAAMAVGASGLTPSMIEEIVLAACRATSTEATPLRRHQKRRGTKGGTLKRRRSDKLASASHDLATPLQAAPEAARQRERLEGAMGQLFTNAIRRTSSMTEWRTALQLLVRYEDSKMATAAQPATCARLYADVISAMSRPSGDVWRAALILFEVFTERHCPLLPPSPSQQQQQQPLHAASGGMAADAAHTAASQLLCAHGKWHAAIAVATSRLKQDQISPSKASTSAALLAIGAAGDPAFWQQALTTYTSCLSVEAGAPPGSSVSAAAVKAVAACGRWREALAIADAALRQSRSHAVARAAMLVCGNHGQSWLVPQYWQLLPIEGRFPQSRPGHRTNFVSQRLEQRHLDVSLSVLFEVVEQLQSRDLAQFAAAHYGSKRWTPATLPKFMGMLRSCSMAPSAVGVYHDACEVDARNAALSSNRGRSPPPLLTMSVLEQAVLASCATSKWRLALQCLHQVVNRLQTAREAPEPRDPAVEHWQGRVLHDLVPEVDAVCCAAGFENWREDYELS